MILRNAIACLAAVMTVSALAADATTKPAAASKPAATTMPAATSKPVITTSKPVATTSKPAVTAKPAAAPAPATLPKPAVSPEVAATTAATTLPKPVVPLEVAAAPARDALTYAVDPYNVVDQKTKFFKLAGRTGELDAKTFEADREAGGNLIQSFEKWETAVAFDKDKNSTLDWVEFDAYREAMRDAVLAAFDKNRDNKLIGIERDEALKALAAGKVIIKPADAPRGAIPPTLDDLWADSQSNRRPLDRAIHVLI